MAMIASIITNKQQTTRLQLPAYPLLSHTNTSSIYKLSQTAHQTQTQMQPSATLATTITQTVQLLVYPLYPIHQMRQQQVSSKYQAASVYGQRACCQRQLLLQELTVYSSSPQLSNNKQMQITIKLQENQQVYHSQPTPEEENHRRQLEGGQGGGNKGEEEGQGQLRRSLKWSCEQHAKYVYFLEMNKQKVKSKLVRKSNAFFKEMEFYLKTKTSIQCRSHHQKFEEKYKFPHRIIAGQKKHIPQQIYLQTAQQAQLQLSLLKSNTQLINDHKTTIMGKKQDKTGVEVSCQTEVCDLRCEYVLLGQRREGNEEREGNEDSGRSGPSRYLYGYGMFGQPYLFLY